MESYPVLILICFVAVVLVGLKWFNRRDPIGKTTLRTAYQDDVTPPHFEAHDPAEIQDDVRPPQQ